MPATLAARSDAVLRTAMHGHDDTTNSHPALIAAPFPIGTQGVRMRHGNDIIAGIDKVNFAGDAGRKVGEKIEPGAAEVVERNAAMQRRVALLERKHR